MLIHHYWTWDDGVRAPTRVLAESRFTRDRALPALVVRSVPAVPGEEVRLEFRTADGWELESSARTNASGVAQLRPYPRCEADRWCTGPLDYRIVAGAETAELTITYLPRAAPSAL
ncbi:MAG: hypothetical protein WCG77_01870 [Actinomycetes bacterium]